MTSSSTDRLFGANSALAIKAPVRVATTANIVLAGAQTIDGVAVVAGDRVLVKDQAAGTENGIYIADTSSWQRSPDFDGNRDVAQGCVVYVNGGTVGQGFWYVSTSGSIVIGTSSISFTKASSVLAVISAYFQTVIDEESALAARRALDIYGTTLTAPAGLGWVPTIRPRFTQNGWRGHASLRSIMPAVGAVAYYVDVLKGNDAATGKALPISAITKAATPVVTYTGTDNPTNGHFVFFQNCAGMTQINGFWGTVANVNTGAKTFEISDIDSSAFSTYTAGGSAFNPLKGIDAALAKADGTVVYVAPGFYTDADSWGTVTPATASSTLCVLPWPNRAGRVTSGPFVAHTAADWVEDPTYQNLWKMTVSGSDVAGARDYRRLTAEGEHLKFELAQSLDDCNSKRGTYFFTTPPRTVYIHTWDEQMPDEQIRIFFSKNGAVSTGIKTVYVEGIDFHGGNRPWLGQNTTGAATGAQYFKDCSFRYSTGAGNGLEIEGIPLVISEGCEAAFNRLDGFNYHINNTVIPKAIEINCRGAYNGRARGGVNHQPGVNNGSTMHDGGSILRIGGDYHHNEGPNIADVNGSFVWNVGSFAHDSLRNVVEDDKADFYYEGGAGGGQCWLYDCQADGSDHSVVVAAVGTINYDRITYNGALTTTSGTIQTYTQA